MVLFKTKFTLIIWYRLRGLSRARQIERPLRLLLFRLSNREWWIKNHRFLRETMITVCQWTTTQIDPQSGALRKVNGDHRQTLSKNKSFDSAWVRSKVTKAHADKWKYYRASNNSTSSQLWKFQSITISSECEIWLFWRSHQTKIWMKKTCKKRTMMLLIRVFQLTTIRCSIRVRISYAIVMIKASWPCTVSKNSNFSRRKMNRQKMLECCFLLNHLCAGYHPLI